MSDEFPFGYPRDAEGVPCPCGGYADSVEPTPEEVEQYDCFRKSGCCARAFVCRVCGKRMAGAAAAPDMD